MPAIDANEPVIRILYSPFHFAKDGSLHRKAFSDKNNDLSLIRLGLSSKDECLSKAYEGQKLNFKPEKKYSGMCLLCPQKTEETIRDGEIHVEIHATPSKNNVAHASLIILRNGTPLEKYEPSDNSVNELLNLITNELQARTIGQQYTIAEFENIPEETLLINRCGDI